MKVASEGGAGAGAGGGAMGGAIMVRAEAGSWQMRPGYPGVWRRNVVSETGAFSAHGSGVGEAVAGARSNFTVHLYRVEPGGELPIHSHRGKHEILYCLDGEGEATGGREVWRLRRGDTLHLPPQVAHRVANPGPDDLLLWSCKIRANKE